MVDRVQNGDRNNIFIRSRVWKKQFYGSWYNKIFRIDIERELISLSQDYYPPDDTNRCKSYITLIGK